jgi:hypothetical protein
VLQPPLNLIIGIVFGFVIDLIVTTRMACRNSLEVSANIKKLVLLPVAFPRASSVIPLIHDVFHREVIAYIHTACQSRILRDSRVIKVARHIQPLSAVCKPQVFHYHIE